MPTKNLVEMVVKTSIGENNALIILLFFFFQAEDGIRDHCVTEFRRVLFRSARSGSAIRSVPISSSTGTCSASAIGSRSSRLARRSPDSSRESVLLEIPVVSASAVRVMRSEERRVGKEGRDGGAEWQRKGYIE